MNHRYSCVIEWSAEDNCFVGRVPELPGCMADGHSWIAAARELEDALTAWVEAAINVGNPIPSPSANKELADD